MIAVLQRASEARVLIEGQVAGEIGPGLLLRLWAERGDPEGQCDTMLARILKLRIFSARAGR